MTSTSTPELPSLPTKAVINRHLPTGIAIHGFTAAQMEDYARAAIELNRRAESEDVAALRKELDAEQAAVRHWKANHDQMVARKALLEQRPDLPVDRIPAMREMKRLQTENAALRSTLREVREALQFANDSPNGPIGDTIWMMHRPETLFDFIDAALANPPEQSK